MFIDSTFLRKCRIKFLNHRERGGNTRRERRKFKIVFSLKSLFRAKKKDLISVNKFHRVYKGSYTISKINIMFPSLRFSAPFSSLCYSAVSYCINFENFI